MARVILIIDTDTGKMVDVSGASRESNGRYSKFAKRLLSADVNPVIDYGANGGKKLTISCNGSDGEEVDIKADVLNVSGDIKVAGTSIRDMIKGEIGGKDGEIDVSESDSGQEEDGGLVISLDPNLLGKINDAYTKVNSGTFATNSELGGVVNSVKGVASGISVAQTSNFDQVKAALISLLSHIRSLSI